MLVILLVFFMFWLQVDKVVQMYETMMTRHTTMVVGPTGGGKSVVISTLCQAQTRSLPLKCLFNCAYCVSMHSITKLSVLCIVCHSGWG